MTRKRLFSIFAVIMLVCLGTIGTIAAGAIIDVPLPPCLPEEGCSDPPRTLCWDFQWVCQTLIWPFEFCWYQAVIVPCDTKQ